MSPSILLVPVDPLPPRSELDTLAVRLERAFGRAVRVTDPVRAPAAARLAPDRFAGEPVRAAIAATWGCGCRDRLVGVTAAKVVGDEEAGRACGSVLVLSLASGQTSGAPLRAVGRYLGLGDCRDPDCAMHPGGEAEELCRACRERC
ncbi:MAG: hypothetical protein ABFC89_02305 [Methanospirillum sp.]